jgi:hypothetical protein
MARYPVSGPGDLQRFVVPPGHGAGFRVERHGGLALVRPLTPDTTLWLQEHVGDETSWIEGALAVEMRYFPALCDGIVEAGFLFESDEPSPGTVH